METADCSGCLNIALQNGSVKQNRSNMQIGKISGSYAYTVLETNKLPSLYSTPIGLTENKVFPKSASG